MLLDIIFVPIRHRLMSYCKKKRNPTYFFRIRHKICYSSYCQSIFFVNTKLCTLGLRDPSRRANVYNNKHVTTLNCECRQQLDGFSLVFVWKRSPWYVIAERLMSLAEEMQPLFIFLAAAAAGHGHW